MPRALNDKRNGPISGKTKRKYRSLGPVVDTLIDQCRQARLTARYTQGEVAVQVGVTPTSIVKIELKRRSPGLVRFVAYARACGFDVALVPRKESP